jgi:hypothetical protein
MRGDQIRRAAVTLKRLRDRVVVDTTGSRPRESAKIFFERLLSSSSITPGRATTLFQGLRVSRTSATASQPSCQRTPADFSEVKASIYINFPNRAAICGCTEA